MSTGTADRKDRRRWAVTLAIAVAFIIFALAGGAVYVYRSYVPEQYSANEEQVSGLSPADRAIVAESSRLGQQAGTLGQKLGQAALFGQSDEVAKYGAELRVIGARLTQLSRQATNRTLEQGLAQAGRGATMTADGIQESTPSKVDEGLRLIKQSQETLRNI